MDTSIARASLLAMLCLAPMVPMARAAPVTTAALVDEALAHNPELAAARAGRDAARARVPQAAVPDDPMLEAGLVNAPASAPGSRSEDMTMRMLGLSQKFSYPGKRKLRSAVAEADASSAAHGVDELAHRIARDVRVGAARLQQLDALEPRLDDVRATLRALAAVAESRYSLGQAGQADVLAAQAEQSRLEDELIGLRAQRLATQAGLASLLGRAAGEPVQVAAAAGDARDVALPGGSGGGAIQRPQLLALAAMEQGASQALELARLERRPDFEVKLQYGQRVRAANGMERPDLVTLTVGMNLPLHGESRGDARVAEARADAERSRALHQAQQLETRAGIAQQLAMATAARERVALARDTLAPQAQALYESRLAAWRAGQARFGEVLEARLRQLEVARQGLDASLQLATALAELDLLAGTPVIAEGASP